jgi:hypothetical protein
MNELLRRKREEMRQRFWALFCGLDVDQPEPIILPDDEIDD